MGSPVIFKGKLAKFLTKLGILIPKRPTIDRSVTPEQGETAFNTTDSKLEVYDGTGWVQLGGGAVSGSDITGPIYSRASGEMTKIYGKTASDALAERAVSLWSTTTLWPTTINANSVCWSPELGIFVSVGSVGDGTRVATSYDGINWTPRSTPENNTFRSVCWSPELGLFCAVSSNGGYRVIVSSDGINWAQRVLQGVGGPTWESVCWSPELGMFVVARTNGNPAYSLDGLNWVEGSGVSGGPYKSICWSPELGIFVIIGSGSVATSSDGITWTETPVGFGLIGVAGVCWSPDLGIFVAVTDTGTFATSTDGTTWTVQTSPSATSQWASVAWSPELGLFCASAITGTASRIATSPDGINWTLKTYFAENQWRSVCWSPELGIFCIVSSSSFINNGAIISKDVGLYRERKVVPKYFYRAAQSSEASKVLKTWTLRSSSVMNANAWFDICWSPELGIFVAVGDGSNGGTFVATSSNGIDWTTRTSSIGFAIITSVVWSAEKNLFVAVASVNNVNAIMTSPDGITWTTRTQPAASQNIALQSVTWSPELSLFVAVGTNWIITSPDGITWTSRTSPASRNWRSVTWSPELRLFCAVSGNPGFTSNIMISTNGTTWSTRTAPDSTGLNKVTWSSERGMFIASTYNTEFNHFAISYDGSFWTGISVLNFTGLGVDGDVVWCSELGLFVATSYGSTLTSTNGINWSIQNNAIGTGFLLNWNHKVWSPDLGIFVFLTDSPSTSTLLTSRKSNVLSEILNLSNSRLY